MTLAVCTPFGWPVAWAQVSLTGDVGDSHAQNDASCMVVSGRRLGRAMANPFDDFLLCLVAEGVTRRAGQLALAAFVESFLASDEVDVLWRLRGAVRAPDARLATAREGRLSSTITALFLAGDGTAYGVSVGDSPLLVFPPHRDVRGDGGAKVLGHEPSTALGTGDVESAGGEGILEHWWPDLAGHGTRHGLSRAPPWWLRVVTPGVVSLCALTEVRSGRPGWWRRLDGWCLLSALTRAHRRMRRAGSVSFVWPRMVRPRSCRDSCAVRWSTTPAK